MLYAPVGAACARALHFALKVAANAGHVVYAFRPTLGKACSVRGPLLGTLGAGGQQQHQELAAQFCFPLGAGCGGSV